MEQQDPFRLVPFQEQGLSKNLHVTCRLDTQEEAEDLFVKAKERLLQVNDWQIASGTASADFRLVDPEGQEVNRPARKGDYIRIDIPGPGHPGSNSDDWVHIELIRYDDFPDENRELLGMLVRPSVPPGSGQEAPAHFFSDAATSTFLIERIGATVMAHYRGRNETPNTGGANLPDKMRNMMVALGALAGFSDVQWEKLLEGLVARDGA